MNPPTNTAVGGFLLSGKAVKSLVHNHSTLGNSHKN